MTLVEAAIALPLLLLIAMGVLEFGNAWRQTNVVERAVHTAARVGSNSANNRYADYEILRSIDAQISGLRNTSLQRVIVYDATTGSGAIPEACRSIIPAPGGNGSAGLRCSVYSASQVQNGSLAGFSGSTSCGAGSWDRFWCPTTRRRDGNPTPDRLGVYVQLRYEPITGMFSGAISIERSAVFQIEPCAAGEESC